MSSWVTSTLVFVRDVDASIRFYVDKLGFTLNMRYEEEGRALVAGVSRGDGCALLLTSQWSDRIGLGIIYAAFDQKEFDALRADLESRHVTPKDGWWGNQVLIVEDSDGNQLYFAIPELRLKRRRNRPHSANICFSHRIECQSVGMNAMAKSTSKTSKVAKKVAGAKSAVKKAGSKEGKGGASPSQLIDARIKELGDWRGETLARVRKIIREADPEMIEEWKWRGVPVFEHDGIICTGETYKAVVKLTFAKGTALDDPSHLFNSSLEGNVRRAIDIHEGDQIDEKALKGLIRAAVALNTAKRAGARPVHAQKKPKSD